MDVKRRITGPRDAQATLHTKPAQSPLKKHVYYSKLCKEDVFFDEKRSACGRLVFRETNTGVAESDALFASLSAGAPVAEITPPAGSYAAQFGSKREAQEYLSTKLGNAGTNRVFTRIILMDPVGNKCFEFSETHEVPTSLFAAATEKRISFKKVLSDRAWKWLEDQRRNNYFCTNCRQNCDQSYDCSSFSAFTEEGHDRIQGLLNIISAPHCADNARCESVAVHLASQTGNQHGDFLKVLLQNKLPPQEGNRKVDVHIAVLRPGESYNEVLGDLSRFKTVPEKAEVPERAFLAQGSSLNPVRFWNYAEDPVKKVAEAYCQSLKPLECSKCSGLAEDFTYSFGNGARSATANFCFALAVPLCKKPACIAYNAFIGNDMGACTGCERISSDPKTEHQRCSKCHVAKYCSGRCQQEDWPKHQRICDELAKYHRSFASGRRGADRDEQLKASNVSGTLATPNENIAAETTSERPSHPIVCNKCGAEAPPGKPWRRCSGCKRIHYCSPGCQQYDWKEHKMVCKSLAKMD